jgi:hypothetical protein
MKLNVRLPWHVRTHEGAPAVPYLTAEQQLRRSVLSCLLWEDEFYEDGVEIAKRIVEAADQVPADRLARLAIEARHSFHLRHAPLLLLCVLARTGAGSRLVSDTIASVVSRADEVAELVAIYWRDGKRPLSAQMKKGLARAFAKFDAYELAKYDRDGAIKLRDVMFLVHPKPVTDGQAEAWSKLAVRGLAPPDTWEVALSAGAEKKETFERLIRDGKLGYLALLRNLRNMMEVGCDENLVREAIVARKGAGRVLPFRYVAAALACPRLEPALDKALAASLGEMPRFAGRTIVVVDVSESMRARLSRRSDVTRMIAAAAVAAIVPGDVRVFTFSNEVVEVPARRGMAGIFAVLGSQPYLGTYLGKAVAAVNAERHDRLIVVTDEQSHDAVPPPKAGRAYLVNVASYRNGVGYGVPGAARGWVHVDGFSESVVRWIHEYERIA